MGGPCWRVICANGGMLEAADISVRYLRAFALGQLDDIILPRGPGVMMPATKLRVPVPTTFEPQAFRPFPSGPVNIPELLGGGGAAEVAETETPRGDDRTQLNVGTDSDLRIVSRDAMHAYIRTDLHKGGQRMRAPLLAMTERHYQRLRSVEAEFKASLVAALRPEAIERFHDLEAAASHLASHVQSDALLMQQCVSSATTACPVAAAVVAPPLQLQRDSLVKYFAELGMECVRTGEDDQLEQLIEGHQLPANTRDFPGDDQRSQHHSHNVHM